MALRHSYFEQLKGMMCSQQKASPRVKILSKNHLRKLGKTIDPCGTPTLLFFLFRYLLIRNKSLKPI